MSLKCQTISLYKASKFDKTLYRLLLIIDDLDKVDALLIGVNIQEEAI